MPKPVEEPVVAQIVDGRLVGREIERRDLRARGLVAKGFLGPFADQLAGLEVVGGEVGVGCRDRVERGVERNDEHPGLTCLLDRRHDRGRIAWHQQDALGAGGDELLDGSDLSVIVAIELARIGLRGETQLLRLRLKTLLHFDEEGIGVGLRDEPDDIAGMGWRACKRKRQRRGRDRYEQSRNLGHRFPPGKSTRRRR